MFQDSGDITLKEEDIVVTNVKIDLTRGKDNPLEMYLLTFLQQLIWMNLHYLFKSFIIL
jgi:hypothetical protein